MVTVYAILDVAVLAIGAGVQAGEQGYGVDLVLGRGVFVLEAALVALGAGPAEEVVVAELVAVLTLLNRLERGRVDRDRAVQATGAGVPGRLGRGQGQRLRGDGAGRHARALEVQGQRDLRGWAGFLCDSSIRNAACRDGPGDDQGRQGGRADRSGHELVSSEYIF